MKSGLDFLSIHQLVSGRIESKGMSEWIKNNSHHIILTSVREPFPFQNEKRKFFDFFTYAEISGWLK